jgi:hypothetical protein
VDFGLTRNEPKEKLKKYCSAEITYFRSLFNTINVGTLLVNNWMLGTLLYPKNAI